ncbi:MAG: demethoxyubiquinone hydroxylase family protein [bacterium]
MLKLINAYSAEQQAIAIYKAQTFWRPGASGQIFRDVLAEELSHQDSMAQFMNSPILVLLMTPFNFIAGWMLGSFLSILPRPLCFRIHVWAEHEAAKTYETTLAGLGTDDPKALKEALALAAEQEHEHARRFEVLLKGLPA